MTVITRIFYEVNTSDGVGELKVVVLLGLRRRRRETPPGRETSQRERDARPRKTCREGAARTHLAREGVK